MALRSSFLGAQLTPAAPAVRSAPIARGTPGLRVSALLRTKNKAQSAVKKAVKGNGKKAPTNVPAQSFKVGVGKKSRTVSLGFTAANELFVGRAAMLGVASSLIGELLTGKGALAQLGYETGLPIQDLDGLVLFIVAFNLIAAFSPVKGRFVPDEEDLKERPPGPLQDSRITLATPKKFFGIKGFGFTKANELFVGRVAQLGFAASLIGEGITGKGILGQLGVETGIPLNEAEPLLLFSIAFTLLAAINEGTGKFIEGDDEY